MYMYNSSNTHTYNNQMIMSVFPVSNHMALMSSLPVPKPSKNWLIRSQDLLANEVQLLFHPAKTLRIWEEFSMNWSRQRETLWTHRRFWYHCFPQTTSGMLWPHPLRAFASSSPRRRTAPSCPPSNDGSSNNPPAITSSGEVQWNFETTISRLLFETNIYNLTLLWTHIPVGFIRNVNAKQRRFNHPFFVDETSTVNQLQGIRCHLIGPYIAITAHQQLQDEECAKEGIHCP